MIGILLITHGTLGESLIHTTIHVLNKHPLRMRQLSVTAPDDPLRLLPQAQAMVKELNDGDGVLILTDMYGATPSNLAAKLVQSGKIEAVAGVSLPMLIRALTYREKSLEVMITKAISGGCEGVLRVPAFTRHHATPAAHAATGR
jgi:mannose PTS system EIIA component